jgi:hypothetical protein
MDSWRLKTARAAARIFLLGALGIAAAPTQEPDAAAVIRSIDAAVASRVDSVIGFIDIEHYSVYRGSDETHPVAEMTVKDAYKKGEGKTYTILSESGSGIVMRFGLKPLIENEERINKPGYVDKSWFTSANYEMKLKAGGVQKLNGRDCYVLAITPREKAPNLIDGTLWADARDGTLAKIEGIASQNPSPFSGKTHMMRQYENISGFGMAMHARAESNSMFYGRTVVTIDYSDYKLQVREAK